MSVLFYPICLVQKALVNLCFILVFIYRSLNETERDTYVNSMKRTLVVCVIDLEKEKADLD